jgi:hypothetical protein
LLGTFLYFYLKHGLVQFFQFNFLFYLNVPRISPFGILHDVLYQHPLLAILGAAGSLVSLRSLFRKTLSLRGDFIILPSALSLIAGLFLIPTPQFQYYVFFLPLVAIFAAAFLLDSVAKLGKLRDQSTDGQWIVFAILCLTVILGIITRIAWGAGSQWPVYLVVGYWSAALFVSMAFVFLRMPAVALGLLFAAMSLAPLIRIHKSWASADATSQMEEIRYILENSAPTETVMDGYRGTGVFRPHAFFYWFLPLNERTGVSQKEKQQFLENLQNGTVAPRLILFDSNLRAFSPPVTEFFEKNYEPSGTGIVWKRK